MRGPTYNMQTANAFTGFLGAIPDSSIGLAVITPLIPIYPCIFPGVPHVSCHSYSLPNTYLNN